MERALLRHPRGWNRALARRSILLPLALALATAIPRTTDAQSSFWEPITGPGGGSVADLARQPDGDLFAAMEGGPVYRSTNGGGSWVPLPHSTRRLAALANGDLYTLGGTGLHRSRDDGASWTFLGGPAWGHDLVMTPTGRLLLSLGPPVLGLQRSDDDGVTWEPAGHSGGISAMVVEENGTVTVGVQHELQQSFDDGDHWTTVTTLPTNILALARRPTGEWIISTLACYYFPCAVPQGLFGYDGSNPPSFEFGSENATSIVVRSDGTAFAATIGFCPMEVGGAIYRSSSPGSWTPVSDAATTALVAAEPDGIFAATGPFCGHAVGYPGVGVLSTSGPGTSWEPRNDGLVHSTSNALATAPGILYAQNGYWLAWSIDQGRTWSTSSTFLPMGLVDLVLVAHPAGDVFATAVQYVVARPEASASSLGVGGLMRTQDRGLTWTGIQLYYAGDPGTLTTTGAGSVVVNDYRGGVSRSTDRGDSWTHESAGAPVVPFVAIGAGRSARIFAATQSEIYLSEDDARTWSRIGGVGGNRIAVAPEETAVYVLGAGPVHRLVEAAPGDWIESALPPGPSGPLAVDAQGTVYIATNTVSRLGSGDTQWQEIPGTPDLGLDYGSGRRSILFDAAGFLYVGTENRSVLRSRLPVGSTTDATLGTTFLAFEPGPTPFRDATTFGLVLSQSERVSLVLFDVRGRTVSKLWDRSDLAPGRHVARWLPEAGTASGSYFYRLDVGATARTGRVTLIR